VLHAQRGDVLHRDVLAAQKVWASRRRAGSNKPGRIARATAAAAARRRRQQQVAAAVAESNIRGSRTIRQQRQRREGSQTANARTHPPCTHSAPRRTPGTHHNSCIARRRAAADSPIITIVLPGRARSLYGLFFVHIPDLKPGRTHTKEATNQRGRLWPGKPPLEPVKYRRAVAGRFEVRGRHRDHPVAFAARERITLNQMRLASPGPSCCRSAQ
jgi:hypothetical protein